MIKILCIQLYTDHHKAVLEILQDLFSYLNRYA